MLCSQLSAGRVPSMTANQCDAILSSFSTLQEKESALLALLPVVSDDMALLAPGGVIDTHFDQPADRQRVRNALRREMVSSKRTATEAMATSKRPPSGRSRRRGDDGEFESADGYSSCQVSINTHILHEEYQE